MVSPVSASCLARLGLGGNKRYQRIRPPLPLVLDNRVLERRQEQPERPCLTEMMLLMSCWKKNEFSDPPCAGEIRAFHDCLAKSKEKFTEQQSVEYVHDLTPNQVNKLLRRFPNITHEI
ncbi:PREDICTED: coiled-coil-helix-coiled-coil-helix domain-containing protein 1 isoform X2 [Gavialis gangeticus]|uniref:coiled-coil-helix-coiled-coil-helix domain-containing protein 1 isoform X2 n=1 Tax=Gavialis gangeticus TaxID=94835 RepID=UPI00092F6326|nr:PREDICTED: coiled-coil-helix-coiled-coil-helix domain-containing protein 1 isoform X2 [Gavialis gangeticus]